MPKHTKGTLPKPLAGAISKLLAYKEKTDLQSMLAKRMSVGTYGKFGEERADGVGDFFNPAWFAEISTRVRLQVAEFIYTHHLEEHLIHVSVDGCLVDEPVPVDKAQGKGQWKLADVSPALVISSGLVYLSGKKPQGLTLDDILAMIKEHPKQGYYTKALKKVITLGDALESNWEDMGKVRDRFTSINLLGAQHDREYPKLPQTGGQLLSKHYKSKARRVDGH